MSYVCVSVAVMTTTKRTLRVDDSLWARFAAFCRRRETSMTARLIQHMTADVESDVDNEGSKGA